MWTTKRRTKKIRLTTNKNSRRNKSTSRPSTSSRQRAIFKKSNRTNKKQPINRNNNSRNRKRHIIKDLSKEAITIIATGPLTSEPLAKEIQEITGQDKFYFYDAAAPIVTKESIDFNIAFYGDRYTQEKKKEETMEEWQKRIKEINKSKEKTEENINNSEEKVKNNQETLSNKEENTPKYQQKKTQKTAT